MEEKTRFEQEEMSCKTRLREAFVERESKEQKEAWVH